MISHDTPKIISTHCSCNWRTDDARRWQAHIHRVQPKDKKRMLPLWTLFFSLIISFLFCSHCCWLYCYCFHWLFLSNIQASNHNWLQNPSRIWYWWMSHSVKQKQNFESKAESFYHVNNGLSIITSKVCQMISVMKT